VNNQADAIQALTNLTSQVNSLKANQTTIFAALGATDLAGAMRAIKDIDGRIEAGVHAGVIARAASAGVPTPLPKVDETSNPAAPRPAPAPSSRDERETAARVLASRREDRRSRRVEIFPSVVRPPTTSL
jgi:hypothetical protein